MDNYESKAIIAKITATSRASIKISDSYYTLEYAEERLIPDIEDIDIEEERRILWRVVNKEVDDQIEETIRALK